MSITFCEPREVVAMKRYSERHYLSTCGRYRIVLFIWRGIVHNVLRYRSEYRQCCEWCQMGRFDSFEEAERECRRHAALKQAKRQLRASSYATRGSGLAKNMPKNS